MKQRTPRRAYDDERNLKELARLAVKLLFLCYVIVSAMADKAAENLSKPSSACDLKFCQPNSP
jgi:hypothetical protein